MSIGKVVVVCPGRAEGTIYSVSKLLLNKLNEDGMDARCICLKAKSKSLFINYIFMVYHLLRNVNLNENIILMHFDSILLSPLLRLLGYKSIFNVFHTDVVSYYKNSNLFKKFILSALLMLVRNQFNVFVSKESMLKSKKFFKLNYVNCIYNIYTPYKASPLMKNCTGFRLGIVSRLNVSKNIKLSIRLVSHLIERGHDIKLLIYGTGPEFDELKNLVGALRRNENIIFMGYSDNKQDIYSNIDALISLSSIEGLPTVILESVGFGKPVFHTDCSSGPREIMSPLSDPLVKTSTYESTEVGYLIKPIDMANYSLEELSDYFESFLMEYKLNGFSMDFSVEPFLASSISGQWKQLFKEAVL